MVPGLPLSAWKLSTANHGPSVYPLGSADMRPVLAATANLSRLLTHTPYCCLNPIFFHLEWTKGSCLAVSEGLALCHGLVGRGQ